MCSRAISVGRSREVLQAIDGCQAEGGGVALLTLTFPHTRQDDLAVLIERKAKAWRYLTKGAPWQRLTAAASITGHIRSMELTYGDASGWHPHLHVLLFNSSTVQDLVKMRARIYILWSRACRAAGLPRPSKSHGVDVRDGSHAAAYVSKWGLESEMALSALKRARGDRYTPFQLLGQLLHTGETRWRRLWIDYVKALHGSRQLTWSRGLKERYGIGEVDDTTLAEKTGQEDEALWGQIPRKAWHRIYDLRLIRRVLELAAAGDRPGFDFLLSGVIKDSIPITDIPRKS